MMLFLLPMRWATGPTGTSILVGGGASRTIYYWHVRLASASHANLGEFRSMLPQDRNNFAVNKMQPNWFQSAVDNPC